MLMMVPYTHSKSIPFFSNVTHKEKEMRMLEIVETIQKTLNYPYSGYVHIFYQDPLLIPYIEKENLKHKERIIFVPNMADTMSTLFLYANTELTNKTVMILNADAYPVEGFDFCLSETLRAKKLVYLISRYAVTLRCHQAH